MKSKLKCLTTIVFVLVLFLFGFFINNSLKINKTSEVIAINDSLYDATDVSLKELDVYDIATSTSNILVKSFTKTELGTSTSYTANVDFNVSSVKVRAVANDGGTKVIGNGTYNLKIGNNEITISTTSSNNSVGTFTLNVVRASFPSGNHSSLLYSFQIGESERVYVNPLKKDYTVTIPSGWYYFTDVVSKAEAYDSDATVTADEACFKYVQETKVCTITVNNSSAAPSETVYNVTLFKKSAGTSNDYGYVGYSQSYTAPYTGYYKLEAWGAQGGSDGSSGGFGGYSTGILHMEKGEKIWTTVGGRGADCETNGGGGYNGGGNAGPRGCSGGGGGATHFAYTSGLLTTKELSFSDYDESIKTSRSTNVIMVAGGGGGAGCWSSGGAGGGRIGVAGHDENGGGYGSQAHGGLGNDDGEFGSGGNRLEGDGAGGGGGLYGGGAGKGDVGGGGGSGYIGNVNLMSIYGHTKHMTCYKCEENNLTTEVKTVSTTAYSSNAISDQAKRGNGYATISFLDLSENYYLTDLRVLDPTSKRVIEFDAEPGTTEPEVFTYDNLNYEITLPADQTRIVIRPSSTDPQLVITGDLEEQKVPAGDHQFKVTATSQLGVAKTYIIETHREPSDSIKVNQIQINGLIEKYCQLDFDGNQNFIYNDEHDLLNFCDYYYGGTNEDYIGSIANTQSTAPTTIGWDPDIHEYDLVVQQRIKEVSFEIVNDNENQQITGGGTVQLRPGDNAITIDVVSEKCYIDYYDEDFKDAIIPNDKKDECTNGYTYHIYRDYYHDADLKELYINTNEHFEDDDGKQVGFDLNFTDPAVLDYYFSVPNSWTYVKDLVATPDIYEYGTDVIPSNATYEVIGNEPGVLEVGKTTIITVRVTAPDDETQQDYKLHVYRNLNQNYFLESLRYYNKDVIELPLTPAFYKKTFDYSVVVPTNNAKGYIRFKPVQNTSSVVLTRTSPGSATIDITPNSDGEYFAELDLARGDNTFQIKVTSQLGGESVGYYTINVHRELSNDSSISGVIAKTNDKYWTLVPPFDPVQTSYDITVDAGTPFVDIIPVTNDEKATYVVNEGRNITSGFNTKTLVITSEDGTSTTTYTFEIYRPPFTDSNLYGISVTSDNSEDATVYAIDPTFEPGVYDYTLTVPNLVTNVWIWYDTGGKYQTVHTNYSNGENGVSLHTGANKFTFEVTSEDGLSTSNYTLTIYREINTIVTLGDLQIKYIDLNGSQHNGTINEPVNAVTTEYTATAPYYMKSATLYVTPSVSTVKVDPEYPTSALNYGENIITFKLKTDDDQYSQDYKVTVTRIFNPDVGLSYLTLEDEFGNYHELTPTFNPMVLNYTANVSNKSNYVKIHAGSSSKTAKISGTGTHALNYGFNTYKVYVTNTDTSTNITYTETYTLVVKRDSSGDPCPDEIELYYPSSGYGDTIHWSKSNFTCEDEEFNITVRKSDKLYVRVKSPYRVIQNVTVLGLPNSYTKGSTETFYVTIVSQDGNNSVNYTFNVTYPEYIGSNYLLNLQVFNGDEEYPVKQQSNTSLNFDKTVNDYIVTVTVPYAVTHVNIVATKEDPQASVSGAGSKYVPTNHNRELDPSGALDGADNVFTLVVTPASDSDTTDTRTYTIIINREHGHDARLSSLVAYYESPFPNLVASVDSYQFYDSEYRTTKKNFDKDTLDGYYLLIDSYADHPFADKNIRATKMDENASYTVTPKTISRTEYTEVPITVTAEDGITQNIYKLNVMRTEGTLAYLSSLCLYNDTEEKCETLYPEPQSGDIWGSISFHPQTETYYAYVDSSFDKNHGLTAKELNSSNVLYTLFDGAATDTRVTPTLALVRDNFVEYDIKVDSEDGLSHITYKLYVMLVLGRDARISEVRIPRGVLLNKTKYFLGYNPEETEALEYYWIIPDAYYNSYDDSSLTYKMFDKKAWSQKTYDSTNKIITINTKSEDEETSYTYKFIMKRYSDVNVTAKTLRIYDAVKMDNDDPTKPFEYPYTPDLEDFVFEYTTHVYEDATALNIDFELKDVGSSFTGPTNPIALSGTSQDIVYTVTSPDGTFVVPYTIHVIRDIKTEKNASDLYLIDEGTEDGPICKGQHCILQPTFDPDRSGYMTTIPYEYKNMYFYVGLNEQQTARFFDAGLNEIQNRTYRITETEGKDLVYEGYEIPTGESEVRINIYDGLNQLTNYYLVQFDRKKSDDASLSDLKVKKADDSGYYTLNETFDPDSFTYSVYVPKGTEEVKIEYEKGNEDADVSIQGETGLHDGINKVLVTVLAQDGITKNVYTVYVAVGVDYRSLLANITVSSGLQFYDLTPKFFNMETEYYVVVPSSTTQVIVEGVVETSSTTVVGNDSYELTTGNNEIIIKGQYYEGDELKSETEYHVTIYRRYPNNVRLSYLSVREGPLSPEFDTGTTNYNVSVPAGTTQVHISATPEYPESTVNIVGANNLKSGYNIVNVYVVNDTRTLTKTYQISVFVRPSNDASLAMIDVYGDSSKTNRLGVKNFESTKYTYDMEVSAETDGVFIVATPNVAMASVAGTGYNALSYGDNKIEILVTAEDEIEHSTYTINIYRQYNLLLKELTHNHIDDYPLEPAFDPLVNDYKITVPFDVKSLKFNAVAQAGSAVNLAYNSINYLEIGENPIKFTITDKNGNKNVYTVVVDRVGNANNYLAQLVPAQGMLDDDFARDNQTYDLLLPNNLKFCDITDWIITPEDEYATYEVSGHESFDPEKDGQQIKIVVTAQNGAKRTYTLNLKFYPPEYFKHYLSALWLDNDKEGTELASFPLSPKYDMETGSYTATLPYGTTDVTIHAVPLTYTDKVYIDGKYSNDPSLPEDERNKKQVSLNFGRNVFKIRVDGGSAGYKVYTLIIYRTSSPDATLASLTVEGYSYTPIFNKKINDYYLTIPTSVKNLDVTYIASDPASTVVITGNTELSPTKINEINVEVTSPDGVTKRTYVIHITMEADKDNYLEELIVQGYDLSPAFTTTNTGTYEVKVPTSVSKVLVYANASSPTAYVELDNGTDKFSGIDIVSGAMKLKPGNNYVQVSVTADSGDVRVYTVNIFKEYKTISTLQALYTECSLGVPATSYSTDGYTPTFSASTLVYYETVPYDDNAFYTVIGMKVPDSNAKVKSPGSVKLKEGVNTVDIEVTAEDGVTKTNYKIYVTMEKAPSTKLKELSIGEGELSPKFDKDTLYYYVEVPSEVTNFNFNSSNNPTGIDFIVPEDSTATYTVTGNSSFPQNGVKSVTITVKCGAGATQCASVPDTTYTIDVYRSIVGDDKLDQLYIKDYPFTPTFNPLTMKYTREVETTVDKVTVGAFRTNADAKISINGVEKTGMGGEEEVNLNYGENIVYVQVVASNGAKRTYQIVITRKDTGNFLTKLESNTGTWTTTPTESLLKTQFDYELTLPDGVKKIKLKGDWTEGATVTNIAKTDTEVEVPVGSNLIYTITVSSASGDTNTYNVTIHGAKSANTGITLDTSKGEPDYLGDKKYELTVKDDVTSLELIVTPDDEGATVVKQPFYALQYGETVIKFQVKSSDGTKTDEYTLTVYRGKDLEKIIPDETEIVLVVDEEKTITYTLEPADATSKDIQFVSKDTSIATVDSDGKVKGISKGKVIVELQNVKNGTPTGIKAEVSVYVLDKRISTSVYNLAHKDDTDNEYNLYDLDYVAGMQPKTSLNDLLDNFDNPATYLHVYENGVKITDLTRFAGSGMKLKLEIGGKVYDEITIVVKGDDGSEDVPGNGIITASDTATVSNALSGKETLNNLRKAIFDIDYNGIVTASDGAVTKNYLSGKLSKI